MGFRFVIFLLSIAMLSTPMLSDANLVFKKIDRRIDLTSQIVRIASTLKVENMGPDVESEVLLALPDYQAKNLVYLTAIPSEGKGKPTVSTASLPIKVVDPVIGGIPPDWTFYSVSLPKALGKGKSVTLDVLAVLTHFLQPFPEQITQADTQLVLFQDSAYYHSAYVVEVQSLSIRLPSARIESYTKLQKTKLVDSEIKYGPYEDILRFSDSPIVIHFENNRPFAVAQELVREIEISHWGNVQVTEHYNLIHGGAYNKGGFSRIDYQARPHVRGASSFNHLIARLPPRAYSVYYRDQIGNISTSHLWGDSRKTELEIEPRYPMFGGWTTSFTIGYGLPLQDFVFESEGKRFLNFSFGCPMNEVVIDNLIVKVVLPEGSTDISFSIPFPVKQRQELKFSHLDIVGRPVVVLEKTNVVPEYNQYFRVYYKFSSLSLLSEPFMLISGFFLLFVASIIYMHADLSISKSSASYLAKLQWDEVQTTVHQVRSSIYRCLTIHDKLEVSLHDLSRTGDVQTCKAARKAADGLLKELAKELKPLMGFLQSSPQAAHILPKVEELVTKERELQEKLMLKHATVVDCYEKKFKGREIENRIASHQQKVRVLRQEVDDLLEYVDEI